VRTLAAFAGNLPPRLSSFVGRGAELAGLEAAVAASALVTVTGPGGVGKTRLAVQAAADQLPSFPDGAWLCELAAVDDAESMAQLVAAALGVRPRPGSSTAGSVVEFLRTRTGLLLVLDNCEHLLAAAAALAADILRGCQGVRIVATSRQALGVEGEQVFGLRPLSLPPPDADLAAAAGSEAVDLFVQRAAAARGDFALSTSNVAAVGEICRRLDGIPLAIELAAARVGALRPAEIAGLLDERFRLLTRGRAGAAGRQQTLQATVEWSYTLAGETEQRLFDALGAFPASFGADAAAAVAAAAGLDRWDVLDGLTALVAQSLLAGEDGPDQTTRYRLLETMRAYARQHLTAAQRTRLARGHARFYAAFAERAAQEISGPAQLDWQRRIRAERDNLHAAVTWALARGGHDPRLAFRIVTALLALEGLANVIIRGLAEACLTRLDACPPELRAPVLTAGAFSALNAGDLPLAQRLAEQALAEPAPGDPLTSWATRAAIAEIYYVTGQPQRGVSLAREARHEAAERGIEYQAGYSLTIEAAALNRAGDHDAARPPAMEAVEIARRIRNPFLLATASLAAAEAIWRSEPQAALLLVEDSLALTRAGAQDTVEGIALTLAAVIRARTGDLPGALAALQEATLQHHADGALGALGDTLRIAAGMLARLGEAGPAAVLYGAVAAVPGALTASNEGEQRAIGRSQALARDALGEAAYDAAFSRGAAMDEDEVVRYAMGEFQRVAALLAQPGARAPHAPPGPASGPSGTTAVPHLPG
jgi:predicted ATPase